VPNDLDETHSSGRGILLHVQVQVRTWLDIAKLYQQSLVLSEFGSFHLFWELEFLVTLYVAIG
jgi:hypothetical protein